MKEITLRFREVAVDGLPGKSMDCACCYGNGEYRKPWELHFSKKYQAFNIHDYSDDVSTAFPRDCITHWMPLSEFAAAFGEGEEDVQTLD